MQRLYPTRLAPSAAAPRPRRLAACLVILLLPMGGCTSIREMLGMKGNYLFLAEDALATPGQQVRVGVRLQKGSFLSDDKGEMVRFVLHARLVGQAMTDDEGWATISYTTDMPGDYLFTATCRPGGQADREVQTQVLLAVRPAYTPLCVVDLDKTLVDAGFKHVLGGKAQPMEMSTRVMDRLAGRYAIVYLTARPEYLELRTRDWLNEHKFPPAPVFLADVKQLLGGSRNYKTHVLANIRKSFTGLGVGIGNTKGDMEAYAANDLTPIFLVYLAKKEKQEKSEIRKKIEQVRELPATVQAAMDWEEIEAAVLDNRKLPAERAIQELEEMLRNAPR